MTPPVDRMERVSPQRIRLAFAVAPIATVVALTVCAVIGLIAVGEPAGKTALAGIQSVWIFAFFGLPIAYLVELVVGLPLYWWWAGRPLPRRRTVVGLCAVVGAVIMPIVWAVIFGDGLEWPIVIAGACMGLAAGGTFVLIAYSASPSRPVI